MSTVCHRKSSLETLYTSRSLRSAWCVFQCSSVKLRPFKQPDGTWNFSEKWILREAVKPFITQELVRGIFAIYQAYVLTKFPSFITV